MLRNSENKFLDYIPLIPLIKIWKLQNDPRVLIILLKGQRYAYMHEDLTLAYMHKDDAYAYRNCIPLIIIKFLEGYMEYAWKYIYIYTWNIHEKFRFVQWDKLCQKNILNQEGFLLRKMVLFVMVDVKYEFSRNALFVCS